MKRLLGVLGAFLAAWLGGTTVAIAAPSASELSQAVYAYGGHHPVSPAHAPTEREPPPAAHSQDTTYDPVHRGSGVVLPDPDGTTPGETTRYTAVAHAVQVARATSKTQEPPEVADADLVVFEWAGVAANAGARLEIQLGTKIEGQLGKRGWTPESMEDLIINPSRTVATRDTRYLPGGGRNDAPATGYINRTGGYVVRNDETGDIVQVSNLNDPNWKSPW